MHGQLIELLCAIDSLRRPNVGEGVRMAVACFSEPRQQVM